ncbi:ATP-binding cassette domain-containing protein [Zobellia galactanivorans]|uniref:ABC transporter, ATPase component n=1 Tax=Zobellia galactanivorans (strain DSM 12802 / CCUG 47099 / CIP 106680 / NCIMB 13871 / Dsij) TaxID=63186 RepID=G0L6F7_ZOBGA|nr:ATP-binding cassette domain-containing protein [Zobellia galactanivorans]MBU3027865.1 ATP-binding cassette domain-containing protein [Zobellia galactanivorans]CAZ96900.1 ABC transporter, ATPase component [Zobellia galactanivorans]
MTQKHWAIFTGNTSQKEELIDSLLEGPLPKGFNELKHLEGSLLSKLAVERFIDKEDRHGSKIITSDTSQSLKSMSSGEQKKALLKHILSTQPDFIILDNPFDNLDTTAQEDLKTKLKEVSADTPMIQLLSRKTDLLPFANTFAKLEGKDLVFSETLETLLKQQEKQVFADDIPLPIDSYEIEGETLIELKGVGVTYSEKPILRDIDWQIKKGEFWELRGRNGSGKTTILSMITGENPKGYGQELYIFGRKKGTGESVWEIKKRIGYFTPSMTDKFTGYHSINHMIISGLNDSIGLYVQPTEAQLRVAKEWLQLIGLWHMKDQLFHDLSMGQKRLIMCARAMIKHPPLLILDEPTAGLDDESAALFVALVNKFANESNTTVIFVSHRKEPGLEAEFIYQLEKSETGSTGRILTS